MEIIIEIGSKEEQGVINQELEMIINALPDDFFQTTLLQRIIIPFDFQAEINKLENTDTYKPDAGESGAIPSIFLRLSIFPIGRRSAARPSAGNANR